uniref:Calcium homeostasis endoplasmic reticulum protein n=1 Tax=Arion vulgaris TaxID=1028688 RepID=A0A0B7ACN2_9EUPU
MNCPDSLDSEMKNIIDKLANFVARNGPQFEEMTKQKQKDNPKFAFLFGGEFYTYYKYKVASEIAQINQKQHLEQQQQQQLPQQQVMQPMLQNRQWQSNPQLQEQINQTQGQVNQLQAHIQEQVSQSESNLAAQYQVLMQQQQSQIQDTIVKSLEDKLNSLLQVCELTIEDFNEAVQPIIDSCTKDAILAGKNWIMQRTSSEKFCDALAQYFLRRITSKEAPFQLRLHLIYLINDVMHHCVRRNVEILRLALETVVVPIFCTSCLTAEDDKIVKLTKLLDLWEKNKYFAPDTLEKMRDPSQALSSYQADLITENAQAVTSITQAIQQQYSALEKQHQDFVSHLNLQLATAQQQLQVLLSQSGDAGGPPTSNTGLPSSLPLMTSMSGHQQIPGSLMSFPPPNSMIVSSSGDQISGYNQNGGPPGMVPGPNMYGSLHQSQQPQQFEYNHGSNMAMLPPDMQGPPPSGVGLMQLPMPDFSKPPPGFPPLGPPPTGLPPLIPPSDLDLTPAVPYYELPAGLIAPLIRLEDFEYKPLDPRDIRLPPPMPPSERLLAAVEAFYQPPSRERPRDVDGWEKLGLYEFFRAKQRAKRIKEKGWDSRSRSQSRSPSGSPGGIENSPPRRRFNSEERRQRSSLSQSPSRSRSQTPPSSRSRSPSPRRRQVRSRSQSPLPYLRSSRSPTPRRAPSLERSPTPPSFAPSFSHVPHEIRLGEENKGHQLLKKMGWAGRGLGAEEQGMTDPVEAAEIRDRMDMHKGIGINLRDPFEQFRKNKSQGFIQRMKTRDDEKPKKKSRFND